MQRKIIIVFTLALGLACTAKAGITIHYEGTAAAPGAVAKVMAEVTAFAKKNKWQVEDASATNGKLLREIDEKEMDYEGVITGVVVRVNDNCEPLYFQFGDDLFMQDFVKTQFAGADIHIQIVQLLESLRPHFKKLDVIDESDYWDTHDRSALEGHIAKVDSMIEDIKKKNPQAKGPFKLKSGRIVDVIQ